MKTETIPTAEQLADKFSAILNGWLNPETLAEVRRRNRNEHNLSICHSHDFCDPNQAMIDALEAFGIEFDVQSDEQTDLIDSAWNIAKAKGFVCAV